MPYRKIVPGEKVKASDIQMALNQGVMQFSSTAERAQIDSPFVGMLSHLSASDNPRSHIQVYQTGGASGTNGWVPFADVPLGVANVPESFSVAGGSTAVKLKYNANITYNTGAETKTIFDTDGGIYLPWRGAYLIGINMHWSASSSGDRWYRLVFESGSGQHYGFSNEQPASNKGSGLMSSFGVVINNTQGVSKCRIDVAQDATDANNANVALTLSETYVGLYLMATHYVTA